MVRQDYLLKVLILQFKVVEGTLKQELGVLLKFNLPLRLVDLR